MKPGVHTTELWAIVAAVGLAETHALTASPTINYAAMATAALYAICRTVLKIKAP